MIFTRKTWISFLLGAIIFGLILFTKPTNPVGKNPPFSSGGQLNTYSQTSSGKTVSGITDSVRKKVLTILADAEVQNTLDRMQKDKHLYNQDGAVFQNRENILPLKNDRSYYSEWTVKTPGSVDRGTRRIIEGKGGELYFTDDHYLHFTRVR